MNKEFEDAVKSLPTHFEVIARNTPYGEESLYGLGNNLEELVRAALEQGNVVTSLRNYQLHPGVEVLNIHNKDKDALYSSAKVLDFGKDGLYVKEKEAPDVRRKLLGVEEVSDDDIVVLYGSAVKENEDLRNLSFQDGVTMGNFHEQFEFNDIYIEMQTSDEYLEFVRGKEQVLLDFELFFGLEKYMRGLNFLGKDELISPVAYYSESEERIAVSVEGPSASWGESYYEFRKVSEDVHDVFELKNIDYNRDNV